MKQLKQSKQLKKLKQEGKLLRIFLFDRLLYLLSIVIIVIIFAVLMELELVLYGGYVHSATRNYFVFLAIVIMLAVITIDYLRQRKYYTEVLVSTTPTMDLSESLLFQSAVTKEQQAVNAMIQQLHTAYLNQLGEHRRKQERNHHFVLQWVHHMKTPVSIIDLLVEEDAEQVTMQSIREENDRISSGLDIMLHTARLEKFAVDLHIEEVAVHDIVRKVINLHKKQFIQFSIFPHLEGQLTVETDVKWFQFLVQQLVSNAIKYSKQKPGNKNLRIVCTSSKEQDRSIGEITIIDEGIGIAEHELPRIFDPFYTGQNGRLVEESTGMGLYLSQLIVGKLGHTIEVQSTIGIGTAVTIKFTSSGVHHFSQ
ncbi:sensor histidine kinase [Paenibacillus yanchengensis]|uniref:histidine kinase n=1 Tax=Paenibacillus yanchengensis TaxID=2035833 RepID=A0ABW4YPT9_9BACL